jgi:hypothetical protein
MYGEDWTKLVGEDFVKETLEARVKSDRRKEFFDMIEENHKLQYGNQSVIVDKKYPIPIDVFDEIRDDYINMNITLYEAKEKIKKYVKDEFDEYIDELCR